MPTQTSNSAGVVLTGTYTGYLDAVQSLTVGASGTIAVGSQGLYALYDQARNSTIVNYGTVSGGTEGVLDFYSRATTDTVVNHGSIYGSANGILLSHGDAAAVIAQNSGQINGAQGFFGRGGTTTLTNTGTIQGITGNALYLDGLAASVTNNALIVGAGTGVRIVGETAGNAATLTNTGTIHGTTGDAVYLHDAYGVIGNAGSLTAAGDGIDVVSYSKFDYGFTITNSGQISGKNGVSVTAAGMKVTNTGTITGTTYGIVASNPASGQYEAGDDQFTIVNSGLISGATGVSIRDTAAPLNAGITVVNTGTIIGTSGVAVKLDVVSVAHAKEFDRVVMNPNSVFVGSVEGGGATYSTLELQAGTGGMAGTLSGLGTSFTGFGTIAVDQGATWQFGTGISNAVVSDAGSLTNTASINAKAQVANGGVLVNAGYFASATLAAGSAMLFNQAQGVIGGKTFTSYNQATSLIALSIAGGTVINGGLINGVSLGSANFSGSNHAASLYNEAGGTITGPVGVNFDGSAGYFSNAGYVSGTNYGIGTRYGIDQTQPLSGRPRSITSRVEPSPARAAKGSRSSWMGPSTTTPGRR